MRVLFLNQFFPPDPAPTGVLFGEIAEELRKAGHEVDFVAAEQTYRAGHGQGGRMRREAQALWRMLCAGVRARRADVVVSGTSPPCLLVVATLVALWHRARSVHWVMDLYPEIAVALGEVRPGLLARMIGVAMAWCYRQAAKVVVLDEDMAARLRPYGVEPTIVRPWVFESVLGQIAAALPAEPADAWTWIYSGNLGRAHEWETLLAAQAELERRGAPIRLVFQGAGPSRPLAEARARELALRQVAWRGYAPEEELPASLLKARALVVTQLPAAHGLLWPSKLGLALSLPRPIIWVGPPDGAVAALLRSEGESAIFAPGDHLALAEWLLAQQGGKESAARIPIDAGVHRAASLATWLRLLAGLA